MSAGNRRLASTAAWAVIWSLLGTVAGRLIYLGGLAVLARLLAPEDFGLLAFALVFIAYVETIGDLGTGMALIYAPSRKEDAAQVTFFMNLAMGAAWFGLTLLLAPAVARFFHNPAGEPILRALAWSFPIRALGNTHDALCQKDLRFKARLVPEVGLAAAKTVVAIVLARAGFGVWSLVWGQISGLALWTMLLWSVVPWRPRWSFPLDLLRPMLAYGRGMVAVNLVAAVIHHADLVVVGRMLGAAALGFYQMAYKIPEMSIIVLVWVVSRVVFPAFSKIQAEGKDLASAYLSALRYGSLLTVPSAVGLALLAEPLVLTFFGEEWRPAIPIMVVLAAYTGLRSIGSHAGNVLKASGRPGLLATLGLLRAAVLIPALLLVGRTGPVAVAMAMAGVTAIAVVFNVAFACRLAQVPGRSVIAALRESLLAASLVGMVLLAWRGAVEWTAGPGSLAVGFLIGLATYVVTLQVLSPEVYRQAVRSLSHSEDDLTELAEERLARVNGP